MFRGFQNSNKKFKVYLIIFGLITLSSLIFSLLKISTVALTIFEEGGEEYKFTMFECISCPPKYEGSSYACVQLVECNDGSGYLCEKSTDLVYAKRSLLVTELVSVVCLALIASKLIYMYLELDKDRPFELYIWISLLFLSKTIGIALFFSLGNVQLPTNCGDSDVCAEAGGVFVILDVIIALFILLSGILLYKSRFTYPVFAVYISEDMKPHVIKTMICLILSFTCWFVSQFLKWIYFEDRQVHRGSLMSLEKHDTYKDIEYSCISALNCASGNSRDCETFRNLSDASLLYIKLEIACGLTYCLWIENMIQIALKRRRFAKFSSVLLAWLGSFANIVSIFIWMKRGNVSFQSDCKISRGDTEICFCADTGLIIAFIAAFSLPLTATYYTIILTSIAKESISPLRVHSLPKTTVSSPAIKIESDDKGQLNDTNTEMYSVSHNSTQEDNLCKSCAKNYANSHLRIGTCGHILHRKCGKRVDGNLVCKNCDTSNE